MIRIRANTFWLFCFVAHCWWTKWAPYFSRQELTLYQFVVRGRHDLCYRSLKPNLQFAALNSRSNHLHCFLFPYVLSSNSQFMAVIRNFPRTFLWDAEQVNWFFDDVLRTHLPLQQPCYLYSRFHFGLNDLLVVRARLVFSNLNDFPWLSLLS